MPAIRKCLIVLLGIALAQAFGKDLPPFAAGSVEEYPARQTVDKLTVAAAPYDRPELAQKAFGKVDPYRNGVLPVLVVMRNDGDQTLSLDHMKVELVTPDREHVEATPGGDLKYLQGPRQPNMTPGPIPRRPHISTKKNPLASWELEGRGFAAKMLPSKQSASGFFYFQAPFQSGSSLYLTGVREASSGKELFYFEIPLPK